MRAVDKARAMAAVPYMENQNNGNRCAYHEVIRVVRVARRTSRLIDPVDT